MDLKLSKQQREIAVGLMLGDGHLETQNCGRTYRLKVEHSMSQIDYVEWLYGCFKPLIPGRIYRRLRHGRHTHCGFRTYSLGTFRFLGKQFYREKKKVMPKIIGNLLNPLSVATWFMDDGSMKSNKHRTYLFHTYSFSKSELKILQDALVKRFGIQTTIQQQKGKYWRLYVLSDSAVRLEEMIKPIVGKFRSMHHKLVNIMPKE